MNIFDPDAPLSRILIRIFDLLVLNICFILCSLPVFTIGASLTALYTVALAMEDRSGILRRFFRAFKANFRQATVIWLILLVVGVLLGIDLFWLKNADMALSVLLHVVLYITICFVLGTASFVFPLLAKYDNSIFATLKNSITFAVFAFPSLLLLILADAIPVIFWLLNYRLFSLVLYIWLFLGFSLTAYIHSFILNPLFSAVQNQEQNE